MQHANERLVRQAYGAQARGDLEAYVGLLSDDLVLHIPGRSRIAGDYVGKDDVRKDEVRRHFKEVAQTVRRHLPVVGLINAQAQRDGRTVDLPNVHLWHVRDGQSSELWLHPVDQYAFDAYWQ